MANPPMTAPTDLSRRLREYGARPADETSRGRIGTYIDLCAAAADQIDALNERVERLQRMLDSRPAINAGLPESYITWSQYIYWAEFLHAQGQAQ